MKKITILALAISVIMTACSKDNEVKSKTDYLTNNAWQMKQIIQQVGNNQSVYIKGGINTTGSDYSKTRLQFNADGTGSFTDPLEDTYALSWSFAPNDESEINVIVDYPIPYHLLYTFVSLDEHNFVHTINYNEQGNNVLATAHYIPVQ